MNIFLGIIIGLLVLMFLVTAHEFGHFIMARRNGVKVLEFGIGFPPRMKAWKLKSGLIFSLNWLPIGGFCQMDGESAEDEREGTFGKASFWKKTKILFGGVAMNWLVAFVILTILAWTGMPTFLANQFTVGADTRVEPGVVTVTKVLDGSPAKEAGILTGDVIAAVGDTEVTRSLDVTSYNAAHAGEEVVYRILRGEETVEIPVKLNDANAAYLLGIGMPKDLLYSTWSAPIVGAGLTLQITGETFKGVGQLIGNLFSGVGRMFSFDSAVRESGQTALNEAGKSVSGPVGIIGKMFPDVAASGFHNLMFFTAIISISLACMNVLPIPALDGGRWLLIAIYKIRKKPLSKETEQKIVSRAMIVLLLLMLIVTVLDISNIARGNS